MNLAYYISQKISQTDKSSFAYTIQRVAVVSITIAVFSLLLAFMVLGGFQRTIKSKIFGFSGHLIISSYTLNSSFEESSIHLSDSITSLLDHSSYIAHWQPFLYKAALLKTAEDVQGIILKGIDERFDSASFAAYISKGKLPDLSTQIQTEVAISQKIARYLRLDVGDQVLVYFVQYPPRYRNLKISGIYETGLEDFDEKIVIGNAHLIRRINDWTQDRVSGVEVFVPDHLSWDDAHQALFRSLPSDLFIESVEDKFLQLFDWLALLNRNVLIFLILILLVASFSMISILLILIMERTQMIGVLKAMGAKDALIHRIFLFTGIRLVIKGLFFGNFLGLSLAYLQDQFHVIPLDPVNYYMSSVPIYFDWSAIAGVNLLVLLIVAISLLIPIRVIAGIKPITAIRFN